MYDVPRKKLSISFAILSMRWVCVIIKIDDDVAYEAFAWLFSKNRMDKSIEFDVRKSYNEKVSVVFGVITVMGMADGCFVEIEEYVKLGQKGKRGCSSMRR